MDKTLDRVLKLIALTSSPSEEEARTSALLACQLIREHSLAVVRPEDVRHRRNGSSPRDVSPPPPRDSYRDPSPPPPPPPPPPPSPPPRRYPEPRTMILAHRNVCKTCRHFISRGERVWWRPNVGVAHTTCDYSSLYE